MMASASAHSGKPDDPENAAEANIAAPAYHDKINSRPLDLRKARELGRSMRDLMSHVTTSPLKKLKNAKAEKLGLDPADEEDEETAHAYTQLQRQTLGIDEDHKLPKDNKFTTGPEISANKEVFDEFYARTKQDLSVAREAALLETAARGRRTSVQMMEIDMATALAERRLPGSTAAGRRRRSQEAEGSESIPSRARRASVASARESDYESDEEAMNVLSVGGGDAEIAGSGLFGARSSAALGRLGVFGIGTRAPVTSHDARHHFFPDSAKRVDPAIFGRERPCHVLIVNLGVSKKQQFKQWAKAYGFKITVVTTIRDALAAAGRPESKVDVVLADISEGASNVLDMMRQLRASHACIPVMVATPPASEIHADIATAEALAECHKLGIAAALEKPLAFEQLAVRARVVLERSKKVDEIYNDVRIAKTQKDNSRHKSEHRKAFVEEQYQGTVASRPVSRTARTSRTSRRPDSGYRPGSGNSLTTTSRAGGLSQHVTDDLNSEAQLALAVEQDKAYAERQWYAPSAPSPRNIAEKAAAAVHDRWNDIDMEHDVHSRAVTQGRRSSFADYRVPAPSIGPGGEHHGYDFEADHEFDTPIDSNAAAGSGDLPATTREGESLRLPDTNPAVTSQLAMPAMSAPGVTARPNSTASTHRKPHLGPIHGTETRESLDFQHISPSRLSNIRKYRVLQPKDIAAAAAAAEAEGEAAAAAQLAKKRSQAAELERARKAVLSGHPGQALTPEHEVYGASKRRGSVVAADILQLGRGSLSATKMDVVEAAAARRSALANSASVPALHTSSPWRPAGAAEHKEPTAAPKLHNTHTTAKSVAIMKRHMEAVRVHFIARAAALRERDRREEEAKARKVETIERKTKILGEIKTSLHRASTGVPFTDAHADHWDITQAHHTWAPFDILHGDPKEPPDSTLDNLTKAHHFVRRGLGKREAGEDEAAIAMYSRALKMDTRSTNALLLRGAAHFRLWKVESALADFNRCLLIQPRNEMALYNRALAYYALGNWHASIEDLNTCIEFNAGDNDALQLRGLVHRRMRQYDAAHHDYSSLMYVNMAAARTAAAQKVALETKPPPSTAAPRPLGTSASLPSLAKPLGGAAATHSIASLSFGPEQTSEQLRDILTGGNDLFGLVFEKPTVIQHALQTPPSRKTEEDISSIKTMMSGLIFFRALTPAQQTSFAKACFSKTFAEGDVVTTEAEPVRHMYVILSGECTVKVSVDGGKPARDGRSGGDAAPSTSTEISVDTYKTGDHFGHLSLLFGEQRTLTVIVKSPQVELVLLPRTAFFRIGLDDAFIDDLEHRRDLLQRTGAFVGWSDADLLKLCCTAKYRQCRKHTLLIKQGNMPKEFMVLTKGIVNVYKASDALADVDLRIKTLNEEISNVKQLFSYHHSMRTRKGPVTYDEDEEAISPEPEVNDEPSTERATLLSKILGQGHSQVTSLTAALKTFKAKGGVIDEEAQAAAEAGAVVNENLRLPATTKYRPPKVQSLPDTFVEEYVKELQSKLAVICKQRQQVLRQHGRTGDAVAAGGTSASRQYRVLVESLYPPCILSPLAITDPWHGFEPGEFVAETYVELLVISKTQIDHRMFTKAQIADITSRASRFPRDGVVIDRFKKDAEWKRYRERAVDMIDKRRWPLDMHDSRLDIRSNGRHIVVPIENHATKLK